MDLPEMPSDQLSPDLVDELDKVILEFEDLQSELTYDQAKGALQSILERLQLTPREAAGLEQEVHSLTQLMQKLDQAVVQIAVFGLVGRGKSSLLNALAGEAVFATGPTHGVTQAIQSTEWQVNQESLSDRTTIQRATLQGVDQSRIELIDTPGLDEVAGAERERLAREVA
ncbi:MAG: GTPase, partial [Cyanobacteria bacterium P01_H01_bin.152]